MRHQGALIVTTALERFGSGDSKNAVVTKETCGVLRSVTMGDDRRKDFSGIYVPMRSCARGVVLFSSPIICRTLLIDT